MDEALNPQREQMADESMVRTLEAQADAVWPQERPLVERYALPADAAILDAGCGTGEATARLAELLPGATLLGIDVLDTSLARARARCAAHGARVRFENRSIFATGLPDAAFDMAACRHVMQSIPHPEHVLAELVRVVRPGGVLHLIAEDYGMIHFPARSLDADEFWQRGPREFGRATGTDLHIGRNVLPLLRRAGLVDVAIDYVIVDTLRVPRATFAAIFTAWRDGYAEPIGRYTTITREQATAHFDDMIATLHDPDAYAAWFVPVVSARKR